MRKQLNFWLWCRWFGHRGPFDQDVMGKEGREDLVIPYCVSCNRVLSDYL